MAPRYRVTLTDEERTELEAISSKGKMAARTVLYARALLAKNASSHRERFSLVEILNLNC